MRYIFWLTESALISFALYIVYFFILPVTYSDRNIDGWNINFREKCEIQQANRSGNYSGCVGWTYENRSIYIVTNRTRVEQYETCAHEILHNYIEMKNDTEEEEIVEKLAKTAKFEVCDKVFK